MAEHATRAASLTEPDITGFEEPATSVLERALVEPLRVLVVEDNPGDAELASDRLSSAYGVDFETSFAPSLSDASRKLQDTAFEIVILDLNLPDSEGIDTLRCLKAVSPNVPVVVVSGIVDETLRRRAIEEGAHEAISKEDANSRLFALSALYVIERYRADERGRRLERLLDVSPDAVIVVDARGHVRYVNKSAVELFCRDEDELATETLTFSAREGTPVELRIPRPDAERVGEMRVVDFDWRGEPATLASIRDITEQKKLEMQLLLSDRMATVGTLAAGVAHEINNPLASIVANLELAVQNVRALSRTVAVPRDLIDELSDAREASDRVRQIVRDLKVFSHAEDDDCGPVDVHRILDSSLRMAWNEIRHRARLVKDYGKPPPAQANESRLGQVFLNLLVNAAHAIREGDRHGNEIRIVTGTDENGRVTIEISDTGRGIAAEVQKHLFAPFFTTKPAGLGTGLGLAISHRIVTSLGGEISFDTDAGKGTRFVVALPRAAFRASRTEARSARVGSEASPRRGKVLVIDDEAMVVDLFHRILGSEHDVTGMDSASDALRLLGEKNTHFDIIFCDLMMPQMTGKEFYEQVQKRHPGEERRIIFVTGGAFTPNARTFLDSISNHRVEKPFDAQGLRAIVNDMLRG